MIDPQQYARMSEPQRAEAIARESAGLDAAIIQTAAKFAENARLARIAADLARQDAEKSRADEFFGPKKLAAAEHLHEVAETWRLRAAHAASGKILLRQQELGDPGFMGAHGELIAAATAVDRVAFEAGP